jgi:hypothetical protein
MDGRAVAHPLGIEADAVVLGYTLHLATAGTHGINQWLYKCVGYDHLKDFAAVGYIGSALNIVVTHPKLSARTFDDFIALARSQMLDVAIAGWGTTPHMTGELLKTTAGVSFQYITYRGDGPALTRRTMELIFQPHANRASAGHASRGFWSVSLITVIFISATLSASRTVIYYRAAPVRLRQFSFWIYRQANRNGLGSRRRSRL